MKKEDLFYYRGKTKVSFEPRRDLLAASVQPDLSEEQDKELLEYGSQLKLQPEKVGVPITEENVRVFRFPPDTSEQDKVEIQKRLTEHPLVRRVGPLIHLSDQSVSFMTNEFVVKFKEQISGDELSEIAKRSNLKVIRTLPYAQNAFVLRAETLASYDLLEIVNKLARRDSVEYAELNLVTTAINDFTPNDFLFGNQPHHQVINTEDAWDITRGDQDIIIAVVDSGCDIDHPDFTNPPALGWDKVYEPFDFANMDTDPINTGIGGEHGTKSCGIATANADNNEGIAGVAPGCRLMPIRRPSGGTDTEYADIYMWIAGFDPDNPDFPDPISPGADIISNSFGVPQAALAGIMQDALDFITDNGRDGRGCVVVFSVGNDNDDFMVLHNPGGAVYGGRQWAAYGRTIAVASSAISPPDAAEVKVSGSNFGSALDICAPGGGHRRDPEARTMSTDNVDNGDTAGSASATTNDYSDFGQTSCACPQVAGIAALILSVNPDLTWDQVRQIIRDTADPIDVGNTDPVGQWVDTDGDGVADFSQWYGFGRVNAAEAVCRARWGVEKQTESLVFDDIPEGETTTRAVVFSVESPCAVHFQIVAGPTVVSGPIGTNFGTPVGTTVTLGITTDFTSPREARVWISYTGTADGDEATGTVTIRCQETDEQWIIPITANTVRRPTVAVVLALDKSGSMEWNSGMASPLETRIEVLHFAAPSFVSLIQANNAIGIVSFDHDAYPVMPVTGPLGPPGPLDLDRPDALREIAGHTPNPLGATAIGDAVELAHAELDPVTGYDEKAMIVFTDGHETAAKYIADVADLINERVFAIGLGTAEQIRPAALTALTNGTGGYTYMTGALTDDDFFRVNKYYLQILAGVTNTDIVVDPEGRLKPGQRHSIPFRLNETDISSDVIVVSPAANVFNFSLKTPGGDVIAPAIVAGIPGASYIVGSNVSFYRMTLPVPIGVSGAGTGTWHAILTINEDYYYRYLKSISNYPELHKRVLAHGVRYSLSVHAYANLRMRARLLQDSNEPGAALTLRSVLTEYGLPVKDRASVRAELERPDSTMTTLWLAEVEPGVFETSTMATMSGVYRFRVLGTGNTLRGRHFTREQLLTGAVWQGGNEPPPSSKDDPRKRDERLCQLLTCLINEKVIGYLAEKGINVEALKERLKAFCEDPQSSIGDGVARTRPEIKQVLADPRVRIALLDLLKEKYTID